MAHAPVPPPPGAPGPATRAVQAVVRGRVQGVGFRASCAMRAEALGVAGWVRNQADGSVEVVARGAPAAVEALVEWCRQGPPMARVAEVILTDTSVADAGGGAGADGGVGAPAAREPLGAFVVR